MNHKDIKKELPDFINNLSDKNKSAKINAHLKECESCRKDYEFYKKYFKNAGKIKPVHAPTDLVKKLSEKIENQNFSARLSNFFSYNFKFNYKTLSFAVVLILAILLPINYLNYNKKSNLCAKVKCFI